MGDDRIPNITINWEAEGRRRRGRHSFRWKGNVVESIINNSVSKT